MLYEALQVLHKPAQRLFSPTVFRTFPHVRSQLNCACNRANSIIYSLLIKHVMHATTKSSFSSSVALL
jgi:hypothetical protein